MSAANRKGVVREVLDRYYTPDDLARARVSVIPRSDATEYAFFVWDRWNQFHRTELTWLEW